MKKTALIMSLCVFSLHMFAYDAVQPLDAHVSYERGRITTYSSESWSHIGMCSLGGATVTGGLTWVLLNGIKEKESVIAMAALFGAGVGYLWSSYYVNEECFNSALYLIKHPDNQRVFNLLMCSDYAQEIMKAADRVYISDQFPRLAFMVDIANISKKLQVAQDYLKRAILDERTSGSRNTYLVQNGSRLLKTIESYISLIADRYPELRNDTIYLQQYNIYQSALAAQEAREAKIQSMISNLK